MSSSLDTRKSATNPEIRLELPKGGTLVLRPAKETDDSLLLQIYASTREDELNQVPWDDGQKEKFLRWQCDLQRNEYDSRYPDARYEIILVDDEPAGRMWIGEDDEQIRLMDIALFRQFQGRGVGTLLVKRLIEEARQAGKVLRHMVFILNNNAQQLYERLGFVVIEDLGAYKHMEWRKEANADNVETSVAADSKV
ncbi:MAG TPA: GNAT family N-acetyltransferase [Pyrinomonadaceae bacterium]|nr:GNAT family N-acetyltransferase [Pyrinomonadaceae bacterium]